MTWFWSGAYLQGVAQSEVINHFIEQVPRLTNGKLIHQPDFNQRLILAGVNLYTSSINTNWVGLWSNQELLIMKLFEENRYTGIILDCMFYELEENHPSEDYWGYMLWQDGIIKDWHLNNSELFLSRADIVPFIPFIAQYVHSQQGAINGSSDLDYLRYIQSYRISDEERFRRFTNVLHAEIDRDQFCQWLNMPSQIAIGSATEVIGIQDISLYHAPVEIEAYLDIKRGIITNHQLLTDPLISKLSEDAKEHISSLSSMQATTFEWVDPKNRNILERITDPDICWI